MDESKTTAGATTRPPAEGAAGKARRSPRRLHFGRAALIGLCAGLRAVAFRRALAFAENGRTDLLDVLHAHSAWGWAVGHQAPSPRIVYIGIHSGSTMAGKRIAEAGLPHGCLIVAVERGGNSLLPSAGAVLFQGRPRFDPDSRRLSRGAA